MKKETKALIKLLDKRKSKDNCPVINVDPLGGKEVFMDQLYLVVMNCFINAVSFFDGHPTKVVNVICLKSEQGDMLVKVDPEDIIDGLDEARKEFERAELFEKSQLCINILDRWLSKVSGGVFKFSRFD